VTVDVRYYCPRCGAIATLERDAYLADKSVTPFPLEGWTYAAPDEAFEDADGVRLVCGEHTDEAGCDEPFYLNFVRFEDGQEVDTVPESEYVTLGLGPDRP
jgi:hypothetical protein